MHQVLLWNFHYGWDTLHGKFCVRSLIEFIASSSANTHRPPQQGAFRGGCKILCAMNNHTAALHINDPRALPLAQHATHRVERGADNLSEILMR
jgi:hypothetical protein